MVALALPSRLQTASSLLVSDELDVERLEQRAREEGLGSALTALRRLTADIEAGASYQDFQLAERARQIAGRRYSQTDE